MSLSMETTASQRDNWPFLAGLLLITLASFWPVGRFGFIGYDDLDYVYQNAHVQSGLNSDSIAWAFKSADASNWHPLTWLSLMLDCELFGVNPQEEHWVNLGFHAANTLLLFMFLRQLTGARWRSFLVAALFACHPLHVQSVAWISERKDVLSGFFGILTLMAYVRYCRSKNIADYGWMLLLFILGLLAKPMLVTLPFVMLLLDFWPLGRVTGLHPSFSLLPSLKALLIEKIPLLVLCLASAVITLWAQNSGGAVISMQAIPWSDRCLNTVVSYALYLGKLFWPVNLAIFYPFPKSKPDDLVWLGALLILVVMTSIGFWRSRAQPYLLVGWLWFLVMLLPVIGLVQVGSQSMADRYMYLPSIGLFIIVAWGMAEIAGNIPRTRRSEPPHVDDALKTGQASSLLNSPAAFSPLGTSHEPVFERRGKIDGTTVRRDASPDTRDACAPPEPTGRKPVLPWQWAMAALGTILVAACIVDTRHQLGFWRNNLTLFQHVVDVTPENNYLGYFYLALSYIDRGDMPNAERCLRKSLEINPDLDLARSRLGNVLFVQKKYADAEAYFKQVTRAHPNESYTHLTLGLALAAQKKYVAAQGEYQAAQRFAPDDPTINHLLMENAPKAEAMATLSSLINELATNDTLEIHRHIAAEQTVLGNYGAAIEDYEKALTMDPNAVEVLNNLAWLLATCPDASVRNGPQAIQLAEHACELTGFKTTIFIGTLAAAQAEAGRFDEAIATAQKACANATAKGETELLEHNQELLTLYRQHQAYHEPASPAGPE
jgi:tetratricopeptide (TPR) repeat protein